MDMGLYCKRFLIVLACLACFGCAQEPPPDLPPVMKTSTSFISMGDSFSVALTIDQDGRDLKGRYYWSFHQSQKRTFGDFTGRIEGDRVLTNLGGRNTWPWVT